MKVGIYLCACLITSLVQGQHMADQVKGNTEFALALYRELSHEQPDENLFFSPHSISETMAMTAAGARKNTAREIQQVLNFPEDSGELHKSFSSLKINLQQNLDSVSFSLANSIWAQQGFTFIPEYFALLNQQYQAPVNYVNYRKEKTREKAAFDINNWVEEHTNKQIRNFIRAEDLREETRLVLVNAIWFYGEWARAFKSEDTQKELFYGASGDQPTFFMHQKGRYSYYSDDLIAAMELPYKGGRQSLLMLLPHKKDGMGVLEKNMDTPYLHTIVNDMVPLPLKIAIPKFTTEFSLDLKEVLHKMGIQEAFTDRADFSGMRAENDLKIDKMLHKAKLEVSEEGTQAAAATAAIMVRKSALIQEKEFVADHPFIYLIRDKQTGALLFMGKMAQVE